MAEVTAVVSTTLIDDFKVILSKSAGIFHSSSNLHELTQSLLRNQSNRLILLAELDIALIVVTKRLKARSPQITTPIGNLPL